MKNFLVSNESLLKTLAFAQSLCKQTKGRIATMADLALMRTKTDTGSLFWNSWALTATTIYFGSYKGERLIVVAHHFGPLITDERITTWASSGEKDEGSSREKYGFPGSPKITQEEFDNLVEGVYGEVKLIKFDEYQSSHQNELSGHQIRIGRAASDPLLEALLSNNRSDYESYLQKCFSVAQEFAKEKEKEEGAAEKILELSIQDRYGCNLVNKYSDPIPFPETLIALMFLFQRPNRYSNHDLSISTELHTEESISGYMQIIVLNNENEGLVKIDFDPGKHWRQCMVPNRQEFTESFFSLVEKNENLFVEYPKRIDGAYGDTNEIMFPLSEVKKVGEPTTFTTDNCLFFLKYHIDEVRKLAPKGANAYHIIGEVQGRDTVTVPIQFYQVTPVTEKRILRNQEVMDNLDLLLEINNILIPA